MLDNFPNIKIAKTIVIANISVEFVITTSEGREEAKAAVERALENLQTYGATEVEFEVEEEA